MKVNILKKRKKSDIGYMIREWEKEYGSLSSLSQKVQISKCASPEKMTDYVMWRYLSQGADLQDRMIVEDSKVFEVLSPRRAELLEYLMNNEVRSIKALAKNLRRDYKNVYDDVHALAAYDLIELNQAGRSLKPCSAVSTITILFSE